MKTVKPQWYAQTYAHTKKLVIGVVGCTILLLGIAMIVLPGPAFLVIPIGLLVLASEFVWAKRLLATVEAKLPAKVREKLQKRLHK